MYDTNEADSGAKFIRADGRLNARLALIGEAGGRHEHARGLPFVGPSGMKLAGWWKDVGLQRSDFYIDNVYPYQPPFNDLRQVNRDELDNWAADLHWRLDQLTDCNLLVVTGNTALRACMGRDIYDESTRITKYRGSIMPYKTLSGRTIKMIPTIHPASIFHQQAKKARGSDEPANPGRTEKHCRLDWQRIAHEAKFPEVNDPEATRTHYINPSHDDLRWFVNEAREHAELMSIDIETATGKVDLVGFSFDPSWSFIIPLRDPRSALDQQLCWDAINELCQLPCAKVFQNGAFDTFWLWTAENIWVLNYTYDTMCMHHALDPVDDHDLAYMKSVFLRGQYHKDEAKAPDKVRKYASQYDAYQTYCGIDNCDQRELASVFIEKLRDAKRLDFYMTQYAALFPALTRTMVGGIRTDAYTRALRRGQLLAECITLQDKISEVCGRKMWSKKDISTKKLKDYIYGDLALPVMRKRGRKGQPGAVTLDSIALRKLQQRYPTKTGEVVPRVLENRKKLKLAQFLDDTKCDDDGYMRCEYTPTTEAGRCASRKNPHGKGDNLQNVHREVRDTYVADPGDVFVEFDYSQAECRVVYCISGDDQLIALARTHPDEFDQHAYAAALIFRAKALTDGYDAHNKKHYKAFDPSGKCLGWVEYDHRYFGKRTVHGYQRGLHGETMSDKLLIEGYVRTPDECQRMLDDYGRTHPAVERGYFAYVRNQVLRYRRLTNSVGRCWDVTYERMGDDLFRRAYSFLPQSEVADAMTRWGWIPADAWLSKYGAGRTCATVYDSLLASVHPADAYDYLCVMYESLQQELQLQSPVGAIALTIPVEMKIGRNWKGDVDYKRLPSREQFDADVERITGAGDDGATMRVATGQ